MPTFNATYDLKETNPDSSRKVLRAGPQSRLKLLDPQQRKRLVSPSKYNVGRNVGIGPLAPGRLIRQLVRFAPMVLN
jgi:hypothetical protein